MGRGRRGQLRLPQDHPPPDPRRGNNDIVVASVNSYILQQSLPNAELILFPDSNHGSHFQFTELFNRYLTDFIDLRPEIPILVG